MRRFGEPKKANVKYTQRPGAYAIIRQGHQLLLTEQVSFDTEIQLPGGGIDPGETPVRALHREVYEETGYNIAIERRLGAYQRYGYMPEYDLWARKICHIFLAKPARRLGPPTEAGHTVVWMDAREALQHLSNSGDRHFVAGCRWLF